MGTEVIVATSVPSVLMPTAPGKYAKYRIGKFERWLTDSARAWWKPDLAAYRDAMLEMGLSKGTAAAHLSTIRARYRVIIRDRDLFFEIAALQTDDPVQRWVIVNEIVKRIELAIDPEAAKVKGRTIQDRADSEHIRLTKVQAEALMDAPGVDTLGGLRDTSLIALMLCTGCREAEAAALDVDDLRERFGGELALRIQEGKGAKQRMIPYGDLSWVLAVVDKWLSQAGITEGAVFRSFWKSGKLRGRLSTRAILDIVTRYPVAIEGELVKVRPHDLRRSYARRLYELGVDLLAIKDNLGHRSQATTLGYIGELSAAQRRPPRAWDFDLSLLDAT